jgi:hypothetical protein
MFGHMALVRFYFVYINLLFLIDLNVFRVISEVRKTCFSKIPRRLEVLRPKNDRLSDLCFVSRVIGDFERACFVAELGLLVVLSLLIRYDGVAERLL